MWKQSPRTFFLGVDIINRKMVDVSSKTVKLQRSLLAFGWGKNLEKPTTDLQTNLAL